MKTLLNLTTKKSFLEFTASSHSNFLNVLDKMVEFNNKLADRSNVLTYHYIPGPLVIGGKEKWLRLFCKLYNIEFETLYNFSPMPINSSL